jgi:hypothetical protein
VLSSRPAIQSATNQIQVSLTAPVRTKRILNAALARTRRQNSIAAACGKDFKEINMADLYLKALEAERKSLWATCRLKGLAKDSPERMRIAELDVLLGEHKARKGA